MYLWLQVVLPLVLAALAAVRIAARRRRFAELGKRPASGVREELADLASNRRDALHLIVGAACVALAGLAFQWDAAAGRVLGAFVLAVGYQELLASCGLRHPLFANQLGPVRRPKPPTDPNVGPERRRPASGVGSRLSIRTVPRAGEHLNEPLRTTAGGRR